VDAYLSWSIYETQRESREARGLRRMSTELILIHIGFIVSLVYFVFRSGEKSGRVQMVEDMIDRGIVTTEDLVDKYNIEEQES